MFSLSLGGLLLGAFGLGIYMLYLDAVIRTEFDQKRWAMPAKVYARPLELFEGMSLGADAFEQELKLLRYRDVNCPVEPAPPPAENGKRSLRRKPKPPTPRNRQRRKRACRRRTAARRRPSRAATRAKAKRSKWRLAILHFGMVRNPCARFGWCSPATFWSI